MSARLVDPRNQSEQARWASGGELERTHDEVTALLARRLGDVRPDAARKILLAALAAFATSGYAGTTTRDIAALARLSPAALYVHFRSKEEVLFRISRLGHEFSREGFDRGLAAPADGPAQRLANLVREISTGYARYNVLSRVVQNELRALSAEHFAEMAEFRRAYRNDVTAVIVAGVAAGDFRTADAAGTAHAIISLCVDLGRWYRADGTHSPEEIGQRYAEYALRIAGAGTQA